MKMQLLELRNKIFLKDADVNEIESMILTNHNEYKNNKEALNLQQKQSKTCKSQIFISSTEEKWIGIEPELEQLLTEYQENSSTKGMSNSKEEK